MPSESPAAAPSAASQRLFRLQPEFGAAATAIGATGYGVPSSAEILRDEEADGRRLPQANVWPGGASTPAHGVMRDSAAAHRPFPSAMKRVMTVMVLFIIMGLVLAGQLIRYQVFGARHKTSTGSSPAASVDARLPRGTITDRDGHPLAMETYTYDVAVSPNLITDARQTANVIAPRLGMAAAEVEQTLTDYADQAYLLLKQNVGAEIGEAIMAEGTVTITAQALPKRYYPEGRLASHVLGFVAMDRVGYYGLEGYYDSFLRASTLTPRRLRIPGSPQNSATTAGVTGASTPSTAAIARESPESSHESPLPDSLFVPSYVQQDLVLTLDRVVQHMAETELKAAIQQHQAEGGTVIILEPHGSAVLAMTSWPDFNPNEHTRVSSDTVYINPAISALYEPGSVFKLVTYAAALDAGVITPQSRFFDGDEFVYGERTIQNWDRQGRGSVTAAEALAQSLNVTTAQIAVELGREDFYRAVRRFGFGQITGIELDHEAPGIVKIPGKGNWYPADLAVNSFGQGISVTPLQMANAVAAIASGGVLYRAHIVQQIVDGEKLINIKPQPISRVITAETARTLTQMMVDTVNNTEDAGLSGYAIAGKSGTAEIPLPDGYRDDYTITSFAGFFPADDPQFVVLVKLDRPKSSRWASHTAAPLFQKIALNLINLYQIPPDAIARGNTIPSPIGIGASTQP